MDLLLKNKVALVMGASGGIGFGIAQELATEGANVILASRNKEHLQSATENLIKSRPSVHLDSVVIEFGNEASIRQGSSEVLKKTNIDILVNNSGGPAAGNTAELSLEDWEHGFRLLLKSTLLSTQLVLPQMRKRGWGRILTVTSTAAKEMIPRLAISATFRAGLGAWVKNLSKEVGKDGVIVNNLLPGPTATPRLEELKTKSPEFYQSMASETAMGKIAQVRDLAKVAAFLCSSANAVITGTSLLADGGYTRGY